MEEDYRAERREYASGALERGELAVDPRHQFAGWLQAAKDAGVIDATALALATADAAGQPSARIVLMKSFDEMGYVFYTDYQSQKAQALSANPRAEMLFYWRELERQVRISGQVQRISSTESDDYFASRPRESQISAAASSQSQPVANRGVLEQRAAKLAEQADITRPGSWGGYRLKADLYEFWQGRAGRLHDRFRYKPLDKPEGKPHEWEIVRLQP